MRRNLAKAFVLAAVLSPAIVAADTVRLRDGRALDGILFRRDASTYVLVGSAGRTTTLASADVVGVELTSHRITDPADGRRRLDSLRRSVANLPDPADVVGRYERFTAGVTEPATLAAARQDQALWQDRVDRHLVKLGDRWVTSADRTQAAGDSLLMADRARGLVKAGQLAAADPLVTAALAADPEDASAQYLLGLLRYQQNQLNAARSAFEAAAALVPNHGPTLNNLAVVNWRQHRYADALAAYDAALAAAPQNVLVLDNVTLAVNGLADLPATIARSAVATRVRAEAARQSKLLADGMAQAGLHRFGHAYLSDAQLAQVRRAQAGDRAQLDTLTGQFDKAQDAVRQTDLSIAEVEEHQRRSTGGDVGPYLASYDGGRGTGAPTVFFELQNDADQLQRRRATQVARLNELAKQADAIQRRLNGQSDADATQRLIGPDATPVRLPR